EEARLGADDTLRTHYDFCGEEEVALCPPAGGKGFGGGGGHAIGGHEIGSKKYGGAVRGQPKAAGPTKSPIANSALHPLQRAFFPHPDVANNQNRQEDKHFDQAEEAEELEADGPREQEDRFHVEDHEQDGDDVITDGVASAGAVDGVDAAL